MFSDQSRRLLLRRRLVQWALHLVGPADMAVCNAVLHCCLTKLKRNEVAGLLFLLCQAPKCRYVPYAWMAMCTNVGQAVTGATAPQVCLATFRQFLTLGDPRCLSVVTTLMAQNCADREYIGRVFGTMVGLVPKQLLQLYQWWAKKTADTSEQMAVLLAVYFKISAWKCNASKM